MDVAIVGEIPTIDQNLDGNSVRTGTYDGKRLLEDDAPDGFNFWMVRNEFVNSGEEAFKTPRHRHTFAQIKYLEKGTSNYAPNQDIPEGDIAYFPRAAYYGPQVKENCVSIGMQFGFNGEHQRGPLWESRRAEVMERLRSRGTIENGHFIETDPVTGKKTVRDGVEAVYDERYQLIKGKRLIMAPEAYAAPILMHPTAFAYFEAGEGVELKHLGQFYDQPGPQGDVRISMIRLHDDGTYPLRSERPQVAWSISPGLQIDGKSYPALSCIYSPRGEEGALTGRDGVEVFVVEFPSLD